jgi:hypothetical protein
VTIPRRLALRNITDCCRRRLLDSEHETAPHPIPLIARLLATHFIPFQCVHFGDRLLSDLTLLTPIPRRLVLDFACVLARRVKATRPRARLSANGQEPFAERLACPKTRRARLRHRFARSIRCSISVRKVSSLRRIDQRDRCAGEGLRSAPPLIVASVAAGFLLLASPAR